MEDLGGKGAHGDATVEYFSMPGNYKSVFLSSFNPKPNPKMMTDEEIVEIAKAKCRGDKIEQKVRDELPAYDTERDWRPCPQGFVLNFGRYEYRIADQLRGSPYEAPQEVFVNWDPILGEFVVVKYVRPDKAPWIEGRKEIERLKERCRKLEAERDLAFEERNVARTERANFECQRNEAKKEWDDLNQECGRWAKELGKVVVERDEAVKERDQLNESCRKFQQIIDDKNVYLVSLDRDAKEMWNVLLKIGETRLQVSPSVMAQSCLDSLIDNNKEYQK
jgi:hypothetical protein